MEDNITIPHFNEISLNTSTLLFNHCNDHIEQNDWIDNWLRIIVRASLDKELFESLLNGETDESNAQNLRNAIAKCDDIIENINDTEWAKEQYKKHNLTRVEI